MSKTIKNEDQKTAGTKDSDRQKRYLVKISGEALAAGGNGSIIYAPTMKKICRTLIRMRQAGIQVIVVVGGGNIARGEELAAQGVDRIAGDSVGMLATIQNAILC